MNFTSRSNSPYKNEFPRNVRRWASTNHHDVQLVEEEQRSRRIEEYCCYCRILPAPGAAGQNFYHPPTSSSPGRGAGRDNSTATIAGRSRRSSHYCCYYRQQEQQVQEQCDKLLRIVSIALEQNPSAPSPEDAELLAGPPKRQNRLLQEENEVGDSIEQQQEEEDQDHGNIEQMLETLWEQMGVLLDWRRTRSSRQDSPRSPE